MPHLMQQDKAYVYSIFARLNAHMPNPKGELDYTNPFTLLVAVVLSAQATDKGVNRATKDLFNIANTPHEMAALGLERITDHIKSINLYKTKARHVFALSNLLIERHGGAVPDNRMDLEALPGVGRKTANVVLNSAFGKPTIAVDTHLFRLANRLGLSAGKTPLAVERDLETCIPDIFLQNAHLWLILHGRYVCKARTPLCETCCLKDICPSSTEKKRIPNAR